MMLVAPVFEGIFDKADAADAQRFGRLIEELKVKVKLENLGRGFLLHKWVDASRIHVVVFDDTLEGQGEANRLVAEGYISGPMPDNPKTGLSDLVEKVKQQTARLQAEGQ